MEMEEMNEKQDNQLKQAYRTAYLVAGFIRHTLTNEEKDELDDWILASKENMQLFGVLTDEENLATSLAAYDQLDVEARLEAAKANINYTRPKPKLVKEKIRITRGMLVAASVLVMIMLTATLIVIYLKRPKPAPPVTQKTDDIMPGGAKALISFEDGSTRILAAGDTLINEEPKHGYRSIKVPRNGEFRVTLPDSSIVWLNSESTIRYLSAFDTTERRVELEGEAYFEVAKDPSKPFRVVAGKLVTEATGTRFVINTYRDAGYQSVTLIEGGVKVSNQEKQFDLEPGEQLRNTDKIAMKYEVDSRDLAAFIHNEFRFRETPLDEVLLQLERWYDVSFINNQTSPVHLTATLDRQLPLSKILSLISQTGSLSFSRTGRTITVTNTN